MKSRASDLPPGLHLEEEKPSDTTGLSKAAKKNLRKKEKKKQAAAAAATSAAEEVNTVTDSMATTSISTSKGQVKESICGQSKGPKTKPNESGSSTTAAEPSKKLKNLKKKLRQIEDLEDKIKSGELKNPEKEQLEKVAKKQEIIKEIGELEGNL